DALRWSWQGPVARGDLVPRRGHAYLRLVPVLVGHADGPEHGARGRPLVSAGDFVATWLDVHLCLALLIHAGHGRKPGKSGCSQGGDSGSPVPHRRDGFAVQSVMVTQVADQTSGGFVVASDLGVLVCG